MGCLSQDEDKHIQTHVYVYIVHPMHQLRGNSHPKNILILHHAVVGSSIGDADGCPKISTVHLSRSRSTLPKKKKRKHAHNTGGIIITKTKDNPAEAQHGQNFPPSRRQNNVRRHTSQRVSNLYEIYVT